MIPPVAAALFEAGRASSPEPPYVRHRPEETVLYKVLAEHWRSFLAETDAKDEAGQGLPRFVVEEVEAFLKCGIPAHGFIRVACDTCRKSRVVAFACKRRGFCPSCLGRRMCDFAANLRDYVMPHVPVRQWVLTVDDYHWPAVCGRRGVQPPCQRAGRRKRSRWPRAPRALPGPAASRDRPVDALARWPSCSPVQASFY